MAFLQLNELPACESGALMRAIRRSIEEQASDVAASSVGPTSLSGRLPPTARLEGGAQQLADGEGDDDAARFVLGTLEASYLVAAADGLSGEEREALIELIDHTTRSALGRQRIDSLFSKMEAQLAEQGLEARLDGLGEVFTDFIEREEAMSFAALVAIADRVLAPQEAAVLLALGKRLGFSPGEVQAVLDAMALMLRRALIAESVPPPPR